MFIISPTENWLSRQAVNNNGSRQDQDAYRDYIDNHNFALRADAAANAENQ